MTKEKREGNDRKVPTPVGYALALLLTGNGWTSRELAPLAKVSEATISAYIRGDTLTRERLEELASFMGLGPADVSCALLAARLVLESPPSPGSPVDPTSADLRTHRQAAALAVAEVFDLVLDDLLRETRLENRRLALEEGRKAANRLKAYSKADQHVLVAGGPEYQHWSVAFCLCADSEAAAPHKPPRALELAELALLVARRVEGASEGFKARLQGWCHGFIGNARRVIGSSLPAAEQSFEQARSLWDGGEDPAGLLSEAHLLDMEASLRRALRQFDRALKLHDDALAVALPEEVGSILLNKAVTYQHNHEYEKAVQTLAEAETSIDRKRQPRLYHCVLFNRASSLCLMKRADEAAPIVEEVRQLAEQLRNDVDRIRASWLEANCASGLGRKEEALLKLKQVRSDLDNEGLPFDYALATLDMASIYREAGQTQEIKLLATEMLKIFKLQRVHREGIAAVLLFQEAAEKERVTAELLRQLKEYLSEASTNPGLVFEAP